MKYTAAEQCYCYWMNSGKKIYICIFCTSFVRSRDTVFINDVNTVLNSFYSWHVKS
jgi:hypothetical protein